MIARFIGGWLVAVAALFAWVSVLWGAVYVGEYYNDPSKGLLVIFGAVILLVGVSVAFEGKE